MKIYESLKKLSKLQAYVFIFICFQPPLMYLQKS